MEALLVALAVVFLIDRIRIWRLYRRIDRLEKILVYQIERGGFFRNLFY